MKLSIMTTYMGCMTLLCAFSLYVVALPMIIKLIGMGVLFFYSYLLFTTHDSVKHFIYLGSNQFQCDMKDGTVCFAALANDSIFLSWFIVMRFMMNHNQKSYSVILFKGSETFLMAQRIRQQVLFQY